MSAEEEEEEVVDIVGNKTLWSGKKNTCVTALSLF